MASEWPVAVLVYRNGLKNPGSPYLAFDEGDRWPNEATNIYLHRDAARAWQALRDWCDGTALEWQIRAAEDFAEGENLGFGRGMKAARAQPSDQPPWERIRTEELP